MNAYDYISEAIEEHGRMTDEEVRLAKQREGALSYGAIVESKYFFLDTDWFCWSPQKRRARGADFARRWRRGEFPSLVAYAEPGGIWYLKPVSE